MMESRPRPRNALPDVSRWRSACRVVGRTGSHADVWGWATQPVPVRGPGDRCEKKQGRAGKLAGCYTKADDECCVSFWHFGSGPATQPNQGTTVSISPGLRLSDTADAVQATWKQKIRCHRLTDMVGAGDKVRCLGSSEFQNTFVFRQKDLSALDELQDILSQAGFPS